MHELGCCAGCYRPAPPHELEEFGDVLLCSRCWDEADAEQHEESCCCERCAAARARAQNEARAKEAAACGGLSDRGREALGW
jgi:hypothetical protein